MKEQKSNNKELYLVIVVMAVMLIACFTKINSLSCEIDTMRNDYLREDDILREQINSIYQNGGYHYFRRSDKDGAVERNVAG